MAKSIEQCAAELLARLERAPDHDGTMEILRAALLAVARDQQERDEKICDDRKKRHQDEQLAAHTKRGKMNFYLQSYEAEQCAAAIRASTIGE